LTGTIKVNVHYYEDGNVALTTTKKINIENAGSTGVEIVRKLAQAERAYQEELNRAFVGMNEQSFKSLRRQLPVTRQKVEWDKVGGYRLGSDIRGGAGR
jgi:capping protein alpha